MESWVSILVLFAVVVLCKADCPDGFVKHTTTCYKVIRIKASYADAEIYCKAVDTDLLVIDSAEEQTFIQGYLQQVAAHYDPNRFWLDGNDIQEEGTWLWQKTGIKFSSGVYTNWGSGQPNNKHDFQENCLEIKGDQRYEWNDSDCDDHQFFICEKPAYSGAGMIVG